MKPICCAILALFLLPTTGCDKKEPDLAAPQAELMKTVADGIMSGQPEDATKLDPAKMGEAFVDLLAAGKHQAAFEKFDSKMSSMLPADKLGLVWKSVQDRNGKFVKRLATQVSKHEKYDIVLVAGQFENGEVTTKVVFDGRKVSGLFFFPKKGQNEQLYQTPDYVDMQSFRDLEVTIGKGEWKLPGAISMPTGPGPYPALVLVHGSGPQDRDETIGPNKPFRDLAWGLASRGVAVLRYDKRTKVHKSRLAEIKDTLTTKGETTIDAGLAAELLSKTKKVDPKRIFILGHSLGGMLIPRIAKEAKDAAGFVVMAGNTSPLEELIWNQYEYLFSLDGTKSDEETRQQGELARQVQIARDPRLNKDMPSNLLPLGVPATYWLDLRGYEPAEAAKKIDQPILVIHGARDYQVPVTDFEAWKAALGDKPKAAFRLYEKLNHLFQTGEGKSKPAEYSLVGHVDKQVVDDLAAWIKTGKLPKH